MFQKIFEKIIKKLEIDDEVRENTLKVTRKAVRLSQDAVRATHRREFKKAKENLKEVRKLIDEVEKNIKELSPHLFYKGYVTVMHQEFVEASLFLALVQKNTEMQGPEALNVSEYAYLEGLGDLIGELRRYSIDAMRNEDFQEAEWSLGVMEQIYDLLITLDYPEGLVPGIRRKTDIARSLIEKTKSDFHYLLHGNKLVTSINRLLEKLKNIDSTGG
ncbi:MAG: haloacid dehalogenase [Candidatus Helarchaeota archaeon]